MSDAVDRHKRRVQEAREEFEDLSDEDLVARLGMIAEARKEAAGRFQQINKARKSDDLSDIQANRLEEDEQIAYAEMRRLDIRLDVARGEIRRRALGKESNYGRVGRRALLRGIAEEHTADLRAIVDYMDGLPTDNPNAKPEHKKDLFESVFKDDSNHDARFGNWWKRRGLNYPSTVNGLVDACEEALECMEDFSV